MSAPGKPFDSFSETGVDKPGLCNKTWRTRTKFHTAGFEREKAEFETPGGRESDDAIYFRCCCEGVTVRVKVEGKQRATVDSRTRLNETKPPNRKRPNRGRFRTVRMTEKCAARLSGT